MNDTEIKKLIPLFQTFVAANAKRRRALADTLSKEETDGFCELVLNGIANSDIKLPEKCLKQCRRHKKHIQSLAYDRRLSWKKKKKIIQNQTGRGFIVPLIASVLGSLLPTLLSRR